MFDDFVASCVYISIMYLLSIIMVSGRDIALNNRIQIKKYGASLFYVGNPALG